MGNNNRRGHNQLRDPLTGQYTTWGKLAFKYGGGLAALSLLLSAIVDAYNNVG